ncbi:MAG: hypothetical protein AABY62_01770 [Pseudomonadota bacterium]
MARVLRAIGQVLLYGAFAGVIGYFSVRPVYQAMAPDQALIKLSFSHAAQPVGACHQRTAEELARLPPNMRAPEVCPRERSPVTFELDLDGKTVVRAVLPPTGVARDGAARLYQRFPVQAGVHRVRVRLRDNVRDTGYTYTREGSINLVPGQVFVIDFNSRRGGFVFK